MGKPYIGDIGTIVDIDVGVDISAALVYSLNVIKGNGTSTTWIPTIYNNTHLRYTIVEDDFDESGNYIIQPYLEFTNWKGFGKTVFFIVYDLWR